MSHKFKMFKRRSRGGETEQLLYHWVNLHFRRTWISQLYKFTKFPLYLNYFKMVSPLKMEKVLSKTHLQPYVIFEIIFKINLKQCYTVMRNYCKYISFREVIFLKKKNDPHTHMQHTEKHCRKR